MNARWMIRTACLVTALSSSALAATSPSPTPAQPPPQTTAPADGGTKSSAATKGAYEHDGFYLRASMGFGGYNESFRSRETARYGGESGGDASGFASMGELSIGYALRPGFVLGGGIYTVSALSSSFQANDGVSVPREVRPRRRNFTVIGPFIDWYPDAKKGFHLQGAVGFAALDEGWKSGSSTHEPEYVAAGGGAMFGIGYDWFVSEQWSLGLMARVTGAVVSGVDDNDVRFFHAVGTSPSLMFSATYN